MKIADMVGVGLIDLADDLRFDDLFYGFSVDLGIEGQFNRIDEIFVETFKIYLEAILLDRLFHMGKKILIRDKSQTVPTHRPTPLSD